jgi:hypothetical protein
MTIVFRVFAAKKGSIGVASGYLVGETNQFISEYKCEVRILSLLDVLVYLRRRSAR